MFFSNKYNRLKREDVVAAMLKLQEQESQMEESLTSAQKEIDALMEKGKKETNRNLKLFYAKKINALKANSENTVHRIMYVIYNQQLLGKLKDAIDDKNFIADVGKVPLNKLLADQKSLAKFLNTALNNKIKSEEVLTAADDTFAEVQAAYQPNDTIFGVRDNDDELLAMFETEEGLADEQAAAGFDARKKNADAL